MSEMLFKYAEENDVRTLTIDDEVWFVANDVCRILDILNPRDAVSRLDEDEKGVGNADTLGGKQEVSIISESGLYHMILTSRSEKAKPFRRWVTHEVLPAIRKDGFYSTLTPEKLTEILLEKQKENNMYLDRIDKAKIKRDALAMQRADRMQKCFDEVWKVMFRTKEDKKNYSDYTILPDGTEVWRKLREIWQGDITMYRRSRDKYMKDIDKAFYNKGIVVFDMSKF